MEGGDWSSEEETTTSGSGRFAKWSGIAAGFDGRLYCAPCNASSVLVIDPVRHSLSTIEINRDWQPLQEDKWSGIVAAQDGRLYCAPASASYILVIDPVAAHSSCGANPLLHRLDGAGEEPSKWWELSCCEDARLALYIYIVPALDRIQWFNPSIATLSKAYVLKVLKGFRFPNLSKGYQVIVLKGFWE